MLSVLAACIATGWVCTWTARRAAWQLGLINQPNPLVAQHTRPVAYLGGVGIALAVAISAALFPSPSGLLRLSVPTELSVPALLYLAVGLFDDVRPLAPAKKFLLQTGVAVVAVAIGNRYPFTGVEPVDWGLALLWILTIVNAFNLTDVCDGLVGGLTVIALCVLAHLTQQIDVPLIIAGATFGFLMLNKPPATIFLGDAGSHLLGFAIASLTLGVGEDRHSWPWPAQMLLTTAVPCFELVFLTVVRIRKGLAWWRGSPDHVALRLQRIGMSRWQTDLVLWTSAALLGIAAIGLDRVLK